MEQESGRPQLEPYIRFAVMIVLSMIVMYILTYANSWEVVGHAWFSETRLFMVLLMGGAMAVIMLTLMPSMYRSPRVNTLIYGIAAAMIVLGLVLVRTQMTVDDKAYMEGMIPHHSIAILTSKRAGIRDPRVRELADGIIRAQQKEIKEMSWLISDIRANGTATDADAASRPVPEMPAGD